MSIFAPLNIRRFRLVGLLLAGMYTTSRISQNHSFIQHGSTTLYNHCRNVALLSLKIADGLRLKVDHKSLVRGALLHDYYLYDWHDRKLCPPMHGLDHPIIALENAREDFTLNKTEEDIIKHHMFPLTFLPPRTLEGWIVCIADKCCSLYETFRWNETHLLKRKALLVSTRSRIEQSRQEGLKGWLNRLKGN